jgi:hypothetical protein
MVFLWYPGVKKKVFSAGALHPVTSWQQKLRFFEKNPLLFLLILQILQQICTSSELSIVKDTRKKTYDRLTRRANPFPCRTLGHRFLGVDSRSKSFC